MMKRICTVLLLCTLAGCSQEFTGQIEQDAQGRLVFIDCKTSDIYKFNDDISPSFYVYLEDGKQLLKSGSVIVTIRAKLENGVLVKPQEKDMHNGLCQNT